MSSFISCNTSKYESKRGTKVNKNDNEKIIYQTCLKPRLPKTNL